LLSIATDQSGTKRCGILNTTIYLVVVVICWVLFWRKVYDEKRYMD
jgi:hypothetical protein